MYSELLWKHIRSPQNRGPLPEAQAEGTSRYAKCGDLFLLQLSFEDGRIHQARFQAQACGPVVAMGSVGTQMLIGLTPDEALKLSAFTLDREVGGLPGPKRHAILMFLDCLHQAVTTYMNEKENEIL